MKKLKFAFPICLMAVMLSSCATIFSGKTSAYQKTKPANGQPKRQVRVGYLVADALLSGPIGVAIDFVTGAIYKPEPKK
ncbi:MAG: hypothetical protein V5804_08670 [Mucilaginibacter sp.]|uniref:hypothetical protein n=1 Tax=Mucilaginibacter sp. TaxID=1882438 RepID=UPI0034E60864